MNAARSTHKASQPDFYYYNNLLTIIVECKDNYFYKDDKGNTKKNVEMALKIVEDRVLDGPLDECGCVIIRT